MCNTCRRMHIPNYRNYAEQRPGINRGPAVRKEYAATCALPYYGDGYEGWVRRATGNDNWEWGTCYNAFSTWEMSDEHSDALLELLRLPWEDGYKDMRAKAGDVPPAPTQP